MKTFLIVQVAVTFFYLGYLVHDKSIGPLICPILIGWLAYGLAEYRLEGSR
jgi:hypothetical protein